MLLPSLFSLSWLLAGALLLKWRRKYIPFLPFSSSSSSSSSLLPYTSFEHLQQDGHAFPISPLPASSSSSLFTIHGNTSCITSSHPVIRTVMQRWSSSSQPGARASHDKAKVALCIEGGGMRGCVAAGMVAAINYLVNDELLICTV